MLNESVFNQFINQLINQTGLELDWHIKEVHTNNLRCVLQPSGIFPAEGFRIEITPGWKSIVMTFLPGNLARELLHDMGKSGEEKKAAFARMSLYIRSNGGNIDLEINNNQVPSEIPNDWPKKWSQLRIIMRSKPIDSDVDLRIDPLFPTYLCNWGHLFFSLVLNLLPLEEDFEDVIFHNDQIEGVKTIMEVNRYERSPANRMACIAIHGSQCKICDFDFGKSYGEVGEGFIHVHHLIPVSQVGVNGMEFDPSTDLIPVCPNCHSMLHKRNPPYSIETMKKMINKS
ncbi:MAG: HNH endonuclease [Anaerolineaceae bacterium]|nr:HNH endonuclease [Anaerolineaceae bacterium]